jgi:hypothetical protein
MAPIMSLRCLCVLQRFTSSIDVPQLRLQTQSTQSVQRLSIHSPGWRRGQDPLEVFRVAIDRDVKRMKIQSKLLWMVEKGGEI